VLVEDLITTGRSSMAAIQALRAEGAVVTDCMAIISYGFPEAVDLFQQNGVRLHTTTTFEAVLQISLERNLIDAGGAIVVRDWLKDPRAWSAAISKGTN
jgi:orotate phosphoribosyltransferase